MKFNSQICTTREQSERLLALGLKKETADMVYEPFAETSILLEDSMWDVNCDLIIPAWSLHRLIEIFDTNPFVFYTNCGYDNVIDRIETYIKEGLIDARYMNEGYLEEE